jgi:hypothetical protein
VSAILAVEDAVIADTSSDPGLAFPRGKRIRGSRDGRCESDRADKRGSSKASCVGGFHCALFVMETAGASTCRD